MFNICNPISVDEIKKSDEMTKGPKIDCGTIFFSCVLKVRYVDYIGRYKDQKADSYWDSGFFNTVKTYEENVKHNHLFIYGKKRIRRSFIYFSDQ